VRNVKLATLWTTEFSLRIGIRTIKQNAQ